MSSLIDYAWNPYYSTWNPPQIAGMLASRLGASAVEVGVNQNLARNMLNVQKRSNMVFI